jgi:hypothetical protein
MCHKVGFIAVLSIFYTSILPSTQGFVHNGPLFRRIPFANDGGQREINHAQDDATPRSANMALFMSKVWDRLDIEEDPEPMWYLLNCVAGLEIDLLRQCRQRCEDMEDVEKFVVPTETKTRSHGANRMVQETKVKYLGYVFAKLRLCPDPYEAIQGELKKPPHYSFLVSS